MCFLLHLNPLIPLPFFQATSSEARRKDEWSGRKTEPRKWTVIMIRMEVKQWHKQKQLKSLKTQTVPFLENSILLFGCGQSKISVCQHHMENYSISQTPEEMRKDKGTNRLACLSVMRENYSFGDSVQAFCSVFCLSVTLQLILSLLQCVKIYCS